MILEAMDLPIVTLPIAENSRMCNCIWVHEQIAIIFPDIFPAELWEQTKEVTVNIPRR